MDPRMPALFGTLGIFAGILYGPYFVADASNAESASGTLAGLLFLIMAVLLHRGTEHDRNNAKRAALVLAALPCALGLGIVTPATNAAGSASPAAAVLGWSTAFLLVSLDLVPQFSSYLLFGVGMAAFALSAMM